MAARREGAIAALGRRQHGVATAAQLRAGGVGPRAIEHRLHVGRWSLVHRGVYALGPAPLTEEGRWLAAVLACGDGAALGGRDAAALWAIMRARSGPVGVIVPAPRRSRAGIVVRHGPAACAERVRHRGIPVLSVPWTLVDLAATLPPAVLEAVLARADRQRLLDRAALRLCLERAGTRRGTGTLRALVGEGAEAPQFTRSEAERRMLALCRRAGLPPAAANLPAVLEGARRELDFVWGPQRLVVEVDGWASHGVRSAFEADRARDAVLVAAGWRVIRVTWRQLTQRPEWVAAVLRRALANEHPAPGGERQPVAGVALRSGGGPRRRR